MLQIGRYFYRAAALLIAAGILCLDFGLRGLMRFLEDASAYGTMTVLLFA